MKSAMENVHEIAEKMVKEDYRAEGRFFLLAAAIARTYYV